MAYPQIKTEIDEDMDVQKSNRLLPPPISAISEGLNIQTLTMEWLAGDGSDRSYYRILSKELSHPLVLMQLSGRDAEALLKNGYDWIEVAKILREKSVHVPKVIKTLPQYAAIIIEDYGDEMLEGKIHDLISQHQWEEVVNEYEKAFQIILQFLQIAKPQSGEIPVWCQRGFDEEKYIWELNFFASEFLEPVIGWYFSPEEKNHFQTEVEKLAKVLAKRSQYFVHRDFHSRNLMIQNNEIKVIDFQDARLGSSAYDLVSLIFDSYVPLSQEMRHKLLLKSFYYFEKEKMPLELLNQIKKDWPLVLLQRQLKAMGSFGYLTLKKGKRDYLKYVKPALMTLTPKIIYHSDYHFLSKIVPSRISEKYSE